MPHLQSFESVVLFVPEMKRLFQGKKPINQGLSAESFHPSAALFPTPDPG
jgi:hypothetical protein